MWVRVSWHSVRSIRVYQPMIELMQYLRANQFKIYIVTGVHHDDAKREQAYGAEAIKLCNGIVIMTGL